jgi:Zn-dependent protease with chaperone function
MTAGRGPADVRLAVYLPLLLPALFAPLAGPLSERLNPRHATWLLTGAAAVLAACSTLALALLLASAVVRIPVVASLGHLSLAVLGPDKTYRIAIGMLAGALLCAAALTATAFVIRRYRALSDAYRQARYLPGTEQTVVIDDRSAAAYALPGWPGRVVVTAGMLEALDESGRAALLAHEQAHLSGFHYLFTSAARLAAAANPLLRPAARAVEYTVERWADEHAAEVVGDRCLVARAIGRAAMAAKAHRPRRVLPAALGMVFPVARSGAHAAGPIPRRVAALLAPPPPRRLALLAVVLALTLLAGFCALQAANDLQDVLSLASSY